MNAAGLNADMTDNFRSLVNDSKVVKFFRMKSIVRHEAP